MKKFFKRALALTLALTMVFSLAACKKNNAGTEEAAEYTYNQYMEASPTNWNPHTWEMIALYYSERREIGLAIRPVFGEITDEDNDDNTDVKSVYQTALYPVIYNLNGQRRNTLEKGINIVNGKKVLVR